MAYINKRDRANVIKSVTISFGKYLGCPEDEDAMIVMREPTEIEVISWREAQKDGLVKGIENFKDLMKSIITDHTLMEDETVKMTNEDVVDLIFSKTDLCDAVMDQWARAVFHSRLPEREER